MVSSGLCGCFGGENVPARTPVVIQDAKVVAMEKSLHRQVSMQIASTVAPRDTLTINLQCINDLTTEEAALMASTRDRQASSAAPAEIPTGTLSPYASAALTEGSASSPVSALSKASRGFARVRSMQDKDGCSSSTYNAVAVPAKLDWTASRRVLEALIVREHGMGKGVHAPLVLSQEQRLRERLERLNLEMLTMVGDGNCQFRALSNELFGTQEHHHLVRHQVIQHIRANREDFQYFLGEDFDTYIKAMSCNATWGDELTLRAASDSYGAVVRCITSEEGNWYITYMPLQQRLERELFLAYISPIHYNSLRRSSSLRRMTISVSNKLRRRDSSSCSGGGSVGSMSDIKLQVDDSSEHPAARRAPPSPLGGRLNPGPQLGASAAAAAAVAAVDAERAGTGVRAQSPFSRPASGLRGVVPGVVQ